MTLMEKKLKRKVKRLKSDRRSYARALERSRRAAELQARMIKKLQERLDRVGRIVDGEPDEGERG